MTTKKNEIKKETNLVKCRAKREFSYQGKLISGEVELPKEDFDRALELNLVERV